MSGSAEASMRCRLLHCRAGFGGEKYRCLCPVVQRLEGRTPVSLRCGSVSPLHSGASGSRPDCASFQVVALLYSPGNLSLGPRVRPLAAPGRRLAAPGLHPSRAWAAPWRCTAGSRAYFNCCMFPPDDFPVHWAVKVRNAAPLGRSARPGDAHGVKIFLPGSDAGVPVVPRTMSAIAPCLGRHCQAAAQHKALG